MQLLFQILFKNFWLLAAMVGLINTFIIRSRMNKFIKANPHEIVEAKRVTNGIFLSLIVPFLLLGILQLLGGFKNMSFVFSNNVGNVYVLLSWIVLFVWWAITWRWVVYKNGAKILIKYRRVIGFNVSSNEQLTKLQITFIIFCGVIALVIAVVFGFFKDIPFNQ